MKKLDHIAEIINSYDTYIIDLWGVMHNGIQLNTGAIEVADKLYGLKKKIVFLSNAPRPSDKVRIFLKKLNMNEKFLKNIITSGEAAMQAINQNKYGKYFFHLGEWVLLDYIKLQFQRVWTQLAVRIILNAPGFN